MKVVTIGSKAVFVVIYIPSLEIWAPVIGASSVVCLHFMGQFFLTIAVVVLLLQVVDQLSNIL